MSETSDRDPVERLLESYIDAKRRGERPSVNDIIAAHPEMADRIRELLPTLMLMENFGPFSDESAENRAADRLNDKLNRHLGDYRILREIGRGGMGIVYEAVQESLGRRVALKICSFQGPVNDRFLERFTREAQAAAQLHHTNIVPVFGVGKHGDVHHYAMQFIQGQGLDAVLQEVKRRLEISGSTIPSEQWHTHSTAAAFVANRLKPNATSAASDTASQPSTDKNCNDTTSESKSPIGTAKDSQYYQSVACVGLQVAEALNYAHDQGIIHRDVKPSNLLLDAAGRVWITDFGLAKAEGDDELSMPGEIVGTVRYMAPERFHGIADARSDVYSLGLTLYEMLTLQQPFGKVDRLELIDCIRNQTLPLPRSLSRSIPKDLQTIIMKAIAKQPDERYATAGGMADDLRRFLAGMPISARRTGFTERMWRWSKRNPALAASVALCVLLLTSVAILATGFAISLHQLLDRAVSAEKESTKQLKRSRDAERKVKLELFNSGLAQAQALRSTLQPGRRFAGLDVLKKIERLRSDVGPNSNRTLALRNAWIATNALLADLRLRKKIDRKGFAADPVLHTYIYHDDEGDIHVCRFQDDQEIGLLPAAKYVKNDVFYPWYCIFSPDGRYLAVRYTVGRAFYGQEMILVWDVGIKKLLIQTEINGDRMVLDFSPDSRIFAYGKYDNRVYLFDLANERHLSPLEFGSDTPFQFKFHPDGNQFAVSMANSPEVRIEDFKSRKVVRVFRDPHKKKRIEWSPDGKFLGMNHGKRLVILDVGSGAEQSALAGHDWYGLRSVFSTSSNLAATSSWDNSFRIWDAYSGTELVRVFGSGTPCRFHVNKKNEFALSTDRGEIWDVGVSKIRRIIAPAIPSNRQLFCAGIHPSGRLVACGSELGLHFFDAQLAREVAFVPLRACYSAVFHPKDGNLIISVEDALYRLTIRSGAKPTDYQLGDLELIAPLDSVREPRACMTYDGRFVAAMHGDGVLLYDYEKKSSRILQGKHADIGDIAISPDGKWVATCTRSRTGLQTWNTRATSNQSKRLWTKRSKLTCAFSPDGKKLFAVTGNENHVWYSGSWNKAPSLPQIDSGDLPLFSNDGSMLAMTHGNGKVRLLDAKSFSEIAVLQSPIHQSHRCLAFSAAGTVFAAMTRSLIEVWNLRQIRDELKERKLDWRHPPFRPKQPVETNGGITVLGSEDVDWQYTLMRFGRALDKSRNDSHACYELGHAFVQRADKRDLPKALSFAKRAVGLKPTNGYHLNLLGIVYYRMGNYEKAVDTFHRARKIHRDSSMATNAMDCFFLAMCYQRLGKPIEAKTYFDHAIRWRIQNAAWQRKLDRYQSEAAMVMAETIR